MEDCNSGLPIPGATSFSYIPTYNGRFAVEVTRGVCKRTTDCIDVDYVGIQDIATSGIQIFPNPVDDYIILNIESSDVEIQSYKFIDATGKLVNEGLINSNPFKMETGSLSPGLYSITLFGEKRVFQSDVIVRRE